MQMGREIQRVVTGHNSQGKAVVVLDAPAGNILESPSRPGVTLTNLWTSYETPRALMRYFPRPTPNS